MKVPKERVRLVGHPYLQELETRSADELEEIEIYFFRGAIRSSASAPSRRRSSWRSTIAPDAEPGVRDLRLQTRMGLSNPIRFRVGRLPEVKEHEPNDTGGRGSGSWICPSS